jgi:hypothetical protein
MAYKPGSVLGRNPWTTIHLGYMSPYTSSNLPGYLARKTPACCQARYPYLVLLPMGFTYAATCCHARGALLPHLFTLTHIFVLSHSGASTIALTGEEKRVFSVALSLRSPPVGITHHRFSVEPGLSSAPSP